jgi:hypothetical protein
VREGSSCLVSWGWPALFASGIQGVFGEKGILWLGILVSLGLTWLQLRIPPSLRLSLDRAGDGWVGVTEGELGSCN